MDILWQEAKHVEWPTQCQVIPSNVPGDGSPGPPMLQESSQPAGSQALPSESINDVGNKTLLPNQSSEKTGSLGWSILEG